MAILYWHWGATRMSLSRYSDLRNTVAINVPFPFRICSVHINVSKELFAFRLSEYSCGNGIISGGQLAVCYSRTCPRTKNLSFSISCAPIVGARYQAMWRGKDFNGITLECLVNVAWAVWEVLQNRFKPTDHFNDVIFKVPPLQTEGLGTQWNEWRSNLAFCERYKFIIACEASGSCPIFCVGCPSMDRQFGQNGNAK